MLSVVRAPSHSQAERFRVLTTNLVQLAARENIAIRAFVDARVPHFVRMSESLQNLVLAQIEKLIICAHRLQSTGLPLENASLLTQEFVKQNNWRAPESFYAQLEPGDCVDIYNEHHQLVFANLRFFQILSYSLEDLFCRPWMDLFRRDDSSIHTRLIEVVHAVMSSRELVTFDLRFIPEHVAYEALAPKVRVALTRPKAMAPLFSDGRAIGYVCANEIRPFC